MATSGRDAAQDRVGKDRLEYEYAHDVEHHHLICKICGTETQADNHVIHNDAGLHPMRLIAEVFPRTIILANGEVAHDAPTEAILSDRALLEAYGLELP